VKPGLLAGNPGSFLNEAGTIPLFSSSSPAPQLEMSQMSQNLAVQFVRPKAVMASLGLAKTTLHRRVAEGSFPAPVKIGAKAVGWATYEIEAYARGVLAGRDFVALTREIEATRVRA
jgi:prophage regulatory protein